MPIQPCPICAEPTARSLDNINRFADVKYYRCPKCGHVWTLPKTGDPTERRDVTRPPEDHG